MLEISQKGITDIYYRKFDEHLTFSKPQLFIKNVIWGGVFVDVGGPVSGLSQKTGMKIKCQFYEKQSDKVNSYLSADAFDENGNKVAELTGSWLNEINMKKFTDGSTENLWTAG